MGGKGRFRNQWVDERWLYLFLPLSIFALLSHLHLHFNLIGSLDPFSQDCLDAHNNYRAKHGVPPLMWSQDLAEGAQAWADQLASTDSLQHDQVAVQNHRMGKLYNQQAMAFGKVVSEITRPPLMQPGFDFRTQRNMWVEFVCSLLYSEGFFSGFSGFPVFSKNDI